MKLNEIGLRDPYVLEYEGTYYLYGTRSATTWGAADGFDVYISDNMDEWSEPKEIFHNHGSFWATHYYWAPECIHYNERFYLIATFGSKQRKKGVQILVSDFPDGPFEPLTQEPITPKDWDCLDGTIYFEKEEPWLIFSHSVPEEPRGALCAVRLSRDLITAETAPQILFYADTVSWAKPIPFAAEEFGIEGEAYFSDGPFVFAKENRLFMIWSSWGEKGYSIGLAKSTSHSILGTWEHRPKELLSDGGHGMIFTGKNNKKLITIHSPNEKLKERPVFLNLEDYL